MRCKVGLLFVLLLLASSLTAVEFTYAQTKPAVPEFTLKLVDYMVGGGLQIEIQNQPIIPNNHNTAGIFYDLRYKWHESTSWYHPEPDPTKWHRQYIAETGTTGVTTMVGSPNSYYEILGNTSSHQLDMQVRAINGYQNTSYPWVPPIGIEPGDNPIIVVSTSDWSPTQTITIPETSQTETPMITPTLAPTLTLSPTPIESPTPTPSAIVTSTPASTPTVVIVQAVPMWFYFAIIGLVIVIAILLAAIALILRKSKRP